MNANSPDRRIAVLIDAENVPPRALDGVFLELKKFGLATARRVYGDFNGPQAEPWMKCLIRHAVTPHHQLSCGRRKNASDIALVIDAMDLLHGGGCDAFAIVSSDTDFMRLAIRIREQGLPVYVFGSVKSPERLRNAATRFFYFENLYRHAPANDPNSRTKPLEEPSAAMPLIREAVLQLAGTLEDWMPVEMIEEELSRTTTDFDPRTYGHRNLVDLLVAMKGISVRRPQKEPARMRITSRRAHRKTAMAKHATAPEIWAKAPNDAGTSPVQDDSANC